MVITNHVSTFLKGQIIVTQHYKSAKPENQQVFFSSNYICLTFGEVFQAMGLNWLRAFYFSGRVRAKPANDCESRQRLITVVW